jgi:hypothetical protein
MPLAHKRWEGGFGPKKRKPGDRPSSLRFAIDLYGSVDHDSIVRSKQLIVWLHILADLSRFSRHTSKSLSVAG